jgi:hypothetical protein
MKYYLVLLVPLIATLIKIWPNVQLSKLLRKRKSERKSGAEADQAAQAAPQEADSKRDLNGRPEAHQAAQAAPQEADSKRDLNGRPEADRAAEPTPPIVDLDEARRLIRGVRSRAKEILGFRDFPLHMVLGTFNNPGGYRTFAIPDLAAARVVAAAVPDYVEVEVEPIPELEFSEDARKNNLLLVGSPKRNSLTKQVLSHEATKGLMSSQFVGRFGEEPELHLGENVYGPQELERESLKLDEHTSADFALLAKIPNPFNPDATVVIVAGRHALGTRGAAEFLARWKTEEFEREVSDSYFAVVIYVRAEGTVDKIIFTDVRAMDGSLIKLGGPGSPIRTSEASSSNRISEAS